MLARIASRILIAPLGFCLGLLAACVTLGLIWAKRIDSVSLFPEEIALLGYDVTVGAWTVAIFLAPLMAAPAIVAVLIAEMFAIRSWAYHAVAGAAAATLPWAVAPSSFDGPLFGAPDVLAAGFIGGLTHWLVAGRSSGVTSADVSPRGEEERRE